MEITPEHLKQATAQNIINDTQATALWQFLQSEQHNTAQFRFTHILYYIGGLIAIGAMSLFMNLGWERLGGWGLFAIACIYAIIGLILTEYFLRRSQLEIPAGITAALVVALTPLAVYGVQNALELWPNDTHYRNYHHQIDWRWLVMELATLAVGTIIFMRYHLPFLVMPIAVTLWYMSMDLAPIFLNPSDDYVNNWAIRKWVSVGFGILMLLLAFFIDIRSRQTKDFAFWLYIFGALAFWGGLTAMNSDSELNKFIYFCINITMILKGAILSRRIFVILGAIGAALYIGHLADTFFKDSLLFPIALTFIGLAVIYLGVVWQKHEVKITATLRSLLPKALRELIENRQ